MMELIQQTRELGRAIQQSGEYARYQSARAANDDDEELQQGIEEFNLIRVKLSAAMQKEDPDTDAVANLDRALKETYAEVMGNKHMAEFNAAKTELDAVMNRITGILMQCVNGEDPDTCEPPAACEGNCGSCGGCH